MDSKQEKKTSNFRVVIRVRPFLEQELATNHNVISSKSKLEQASVSSVNCLDID